MLTAFVAGGLAGMLTVGAIQSDRQFTLPRRWYLGFAACIAWMLSMLIAFGPV